MRCGNRIGRGRRLRDIRPASLTACDHGGRIESRQATAFPGELETPISCKVLPLGRMLPLGMRQGNLNPKAHRRVERRRLSRRLERLPHSFTAIRLENVVTGRTWRGRAAR
jgi:hypothetical protein